MIQAVLKRNDKQAYGVIAVLSVVVFWSFCLWANSDTHVALRRWVLYLHIFAWINGAVTNFGSCTAILGLILVKQRSMRSTEL
jgi:hypothetical protein